MKRFRTSLGEFGVDEVMMGQSQMAYYDPLNQVLLEKDLRLDTILQYNTTGIEGLMAQLSGLMGSDNRMVKSNPYYWTEYNEETTIITSINPSTAGVPSAGASVTVNIDTTSMSRNGVFSVPRAGFRGMIKELKMQNVNVTAVTKTPVGHHTITLAPINGQVLDLTKLSNYTVLIDTLRLYTKGDTNPIVSGSWVTEPPTLHKGYVQKFERAYEIHEDELDGYTYGTNFRLYKAMMADGTKVDNWGVPELNKKILEDWMDNRNLNTMFMQRDDVAGQGFDGFIPTADTQGAFSRYYDPNSGWSLKSMIFNWIRQLKLRNGPNQYILSHDFGFGLDWTEAIGELVSKTKSDMVYRLFGDGGTGMRDFQWYQFQDFNAFNYSFRTYQVDAFDARRYGNAMQDFAFLLPSAKYKDTAGKIVPPATYVNIGAKNAAYQKKIWSYPFIEQGLRTIKVMCKDSWGLELHAAKQLGTLRRALTYS
jgi:hypothetical protein